MAVNANTKMYDEAVDRAAMIRLYERRLNGKVSLVVDGHALRVDKLVRSAELSRKGFERFREAVDQELKKSFGEAYRVSKRSLTDFAKDHEQLDIKAAVIEGRVLDLAAIKALSKLPSREEIVGQLLSVMTGVPTGLVRALSDIPRRLLNVLGAVKNQKEAA